MRDRMENQAKLVLFIESFCIERNMAEKYAMKLAAQRITTENILDSDPYMYPMIGIHDGDATKIEQGLVLGRNWQEFFTSCGIREKKATNYGLEFAMNRISRESLRSMDERELGQLGVSRRDLARIIKPAQLYLLKKECSPCIRVNHVLEIIRLYNNILSDVDRRLFQHLRNMIPKMDISDLSDAEIHVVNDGMRVIFSAGCASKVMYIHLIQRGDTLIPKMTSSYYDFELVDEATVQRNGGTVSYTACSSDAKEDSDTDERMTRRCDEIVTREKNSDRIKRCTKTALRHVRRRGILPIIGGVVGGLLGAGLGLILARGCTISWGLRGMRLGLKAGQEVDRALEAMGSPIDVTGTGYKAIEFNE